jgi:hypothetical protein
MRGLLAYGVQRRANSLGVLRQRDAGAAAPSPLLDGLVAYWKLDEGSGTTRIDSAGSNNLADNGGVGSATGKVGNAASFVAANTEYLSNASPYALTYPCAVSFWINPSTYSGVGVVLNYNNLFVINLHNSPSDSLSIRTSSGAFGASTVGLSGWSHWVVNFTSASSVDIYLNGALVTGSGLALFARAGLQLGCRGSGENPFDGLIDEVGIWERMLTVGGIAILYNSGAGITFPF